MKVLTIDPNHFEVSELNPAVEVMQQGGVLAYPTETVYGLGANIFLKAAVERIYHLKKRVSSKPMSIMIASDEEARKLCVEISKQAEVLMDTFWPGPLTLIFRAASSVPEYMVSASGTIGLRYPDHPITRALMHLHGQPVTSTSANVSGAEPAQSAREVVWSFANEVDMVIDAGTFPAQKPSTVVDLAQGELRVVREGAISKNQLTACLKELLNE